MLWYYKVCYSTGKSFIYVQKQIPRGYYWAPVENTGKV